MRGGVYLADVRPKLLEVQGSPAERAPGVVSAVAMAAAVLGAAPAHATTTCSPCRSSTTPGGTRHWATSTPLRVYPTPQGRAAAGAADHRTGRRGVAGGPRRRLDADQPGMRAQFRATGAWRSSPNRARSVGTSSRSGPWWTTKMLSTGCNPGSGERTSGGLDAPAGGGAGRSHAAQPRGHRSRRRHTGRRGGRAQGLRGVRVAVDGVRRGRPVSG